ncbi:MULTISPECIES: hypothetical protein [Brevibacterium]|uniref:Uncharacterized protein n=1 Tax=Brevibacterium gallinarum TaxID=2762220 RepID=A0ABR8WRM9_9MICO|nr:MULTISPECIES: hypothetical protein [Brevibacterium]MBD8019650.1 hypothetical protein [Brevibacterium gallinarum]MCT1690884.1 hypothetical protein [Brevibacterium sp. p3-SID960]
MTTIAVTARPWSGGWELEIDEDRITQVSDLAHASAQVIDYLDTAEPGVDHHDCDLQLTVHHE